MKVELWVLVDKSSRIYYTGFSEETVKDYMDSNCFKDKFVIKLEGEIQCPKNTLP